MKKHWKKSNQNGLKKSSWPIQNTTGVEEKDKIILFPEVGMSVKLFEKVCRIENLFSYKNVLNDYLNLSKKKEQTFLN